jgi:ABC-type amino acid transport substrate-binding protein
MDVAFVGPYFVSGKALLTKDGNLTKIEDPAGLDRMQMRLAALRGSTSEQLIKRAAPTATLVLFDRYDDAVAAVAEDKVNALVADLPLIAVTLAQYPEAGFAAVGDALSFEPIGAAVPAYDAHFQNLIGNYFRLLEGIGVLEALRQRWFGNADWLQALPPQTFGKPLDPSAGYAL